MQIKNELKYCFALGELTNGGQERQLIYLLEEFKLKGEKIGLIVWNYRETDKYAPDIEKLNIPTLKFDVNKSSLSKIIEARKFIKFHKPFVLHSYSFYLNFFMAIITLFTFTTPIGAIRSHLAYTKKILPFHFFFLCYIFPKKTISNNLSFHEGLNKLYKIIFLKKILIITNKLKLTDFPMYKFDLEKEFMTSFSIGRISPEKKIDQIAEILSQLLTAGYITKHYHIGVGPNMENIKVLVKNLGIEDNLILCGTISDVNSFINKHDFMIHAAESEGFPNCIMEAMASGRAVVSTNCGDAKYLISEGNEGFIVPVNDKVALFNKWKWMLENPEKVKEMGENSRKFAEQEFEISKLYSQTKDAYKILLNPQINSSL